MIAMSKESSELFPNRIASNPGQINHMFDKRPGHLTDTQKNRDTLTRISNDPACFKGTDKWGNDWYVESLGNGGQHWAQVRDGVIFEGGYNRSPKDWDPNTGLKSPAKPSGPKPKIKTKKRKH